MGNALDIDTIFCDSTPITEISIVALSAWALSINDLSQRSSIYSRSDAITKLFHRFKKLKKCRVDLTLPESDEDQNSIKWLEFVKEIFKDSVDFKFSFIYNRQIQDEKMEVFNYVNKKVIRVEITRR